MTTELRLRLILAAEDKNTHGRAVRKLLEEAGAEFEAALDILDEFDPSKAKAFLTRHSTPPQPKSTRKIWAEITGGQVSRAV
jgi:hypothetical protein